MMNQYNIEMKYTAEFLRDKTKSELQSLLEAAKNRYLELRQQTSLTGHVKHVPKPHLFSKIRKDIARIKTIIAELL